jgi:hypothetical protein
MKTVLLAWPEGFIVYYYGYGQRGLYSQYGYYEKGVQSHYYGHEQRGLHSQYYGQCQRGKKKHYYGHGLRVYIAITGMDRRVYIPIIICITRWIYKPAK